MHSNSSHLALLAVLVMQTSNNNNNDNINMNEMKCVKDLFRSVSNVNLPEQFPAWQCPSVRRHAGFPQDVETRRVN